MLICQGTLDQETEKGLFRSSSKTAITQNKIIKSIAITVRKMTTTVIATLGSVLKSKLELEFNSKKRPLLLLQHWDPY